MPRGEWTSVPIPNELIKQIDEIVEKDKYPIGKWHSRSHYIVETLKEQLKKEKAKGQG